MQGKSVKYEARDKRASRSRRWVLVSAASLLLPISVVSTISSLFLLQQFFLIKPALLNRERTKEHATKEREVQSKR